MRTDKKLKANNYYHSKEGIWPEVIKTYEASGATSAKIYLIHTRLVIIVSLPESYRGKNLA